MRIGVDIGGTTIHLGLVEGGRIERVLTAPSFSSDFTLEQTMDYLSELLSRVIEPGVDSIGIGVPSVVDSEHGIVYDTANIPSWQEVHLKETLEGRLGIPVQVNNDSNCFALGAYACVCDSRPKSLLGITLGTGVGMGVVSDGKLLNGPNTGVGEISCTEYLYGSYEDYTSSKFFLRNGMTSKQAYDLALSGDEAALRLYKEFAFHLGKLVTMSMYAYDPDVIVFGGGVSKSFELFKDNLMECIQQSFVYRKPLETLKVLAMPSEEVAVIGASTL